MKATKSTMNMVEALRKEASSNKVFDAVCHVFALRKRTRARVTIHGLQLYMTAEGFKFTNEEYKNVITFLARIGVGKLMTNRAGKVTGLSDITLTLQSLGKAAVTKEATAFKNRAQTQTKFQDLSAEIGKIHQTNFIEGKSKLPIRQSQAYPAFLTVLIEGKPINFAGPNNLTADNLADFLNQFKRVATAEK